MGRTLKELGIQMIPAYSPQARGRSERNFGTWEGRLPQEELRLRGITTVEAANEFLREEYIAEFNERFCVPPAQPGSAFLPCRRKDLDLVFSLRYERTVARDNTIELGERTLQIEPVGWRASLAGCRALVHEHLDGTLTVSYGPHIVGRYNAPGCPFLEDKRARRKAVEKPLRLGIPQPGGIPTFPPPRRRRIHPKPDTSLATKTGHFNLLTTEMHSSRHALHTLKLSARYRNLG